MRNEHYCSLRYKKITYNELNEKSRPHKPPI